MDNQPELPSVEEVQQQMMSEMKDDSFDLPLKDRKQFPQLVAYLRAIYKFDRIPPTFFDYSKSSIKDRESEVVNVIPDSRLVGVPKPVGFWDF